MAGDWLKWVKGLARKPEVFSMAAILRLDRYSIAGRLMEFWEWCDENVNEEAVTETGAAVIVLSPAIDDKLVTIDSIVCHQGFASAMQSVGWLSLTATGIELPRFTRHNLSTAKTRARNALNQNNRRSRSLESVTEMSPAPGDKKVTREEKRREDLNTPLTPQGGAVASRRKRPPIEASRGFDRFWAAYPRKVGKAAALNAWTKLAPDEALMGIILAAVEAHKASDAWRRDGGQYIPHPATWLNGRRWEDEVGLRNGHAAPVGPIETEQERNARVLRQRAERDKANGYSE